MTNLRNNFQYKYDHVTTKLDIGKEEDYRECVFKVNFFNIPIREKFIINTPFLAVSGEWIIKKEMEVPVQLKEGIFKMQFELEGYSNYLSSDTVIEIPEQHFNLFYLPKVDGKLHFKKNRRVVEIMFDTDSFMNLIGSDSVAYQDFLNHVIAKRKIVLFAQAKFITADIHRILFEIFNSTIHLQLKNEYIQNKVKELLLIAMNCSDKYQSIEDFKTNLTDEEMIINIKKMVDEDVLNNMTFTEISRKFNMNEFKLKQAFKKFFGISLMKYIRQKKMSKAYTMLSEAKYSIKEVSEYCGYEYPQHFTIAFKKEFGVLPKELKK